MKINVAEELEAPYEVQVTLDILRVYCAAIKHSARGKFKAQTCAHLPRTILKPREPLAMQKPAASYLAKYAAATHANRPLGAIDQESSIMSSAPLQWLSGSM